MPLALELPEILYRIGLYLDADQVLTCSLVCRIFYNAFSPLVWNDLHFSLTDKQLRLIREKTPLARKISFRHLFESNELERDTQELISILQDRAPWMRCLTIHQHESVQQFSSFGPDCNRVETMSIEGIPLVGEYGDQTYWKSCKALLRQNRPDLRSLSLQNWKTQLVKPAPGQPVWNPILACTQHLNLTSLSLVRCKIRGKHLKAFWTISARLEALELEDVDMDLTWIPSSLIKGKDKDKEKDKEKEPHSTATNSASNNNNQATVPTKRALPPPDLPPRFPKLKELTIRFLSRHHPLSQFHWLVLPCPSLRTLTWMFDRHRHFPTQPFMDAFDDTPDSPTAWPHLDSITIRGHSNWISDENHLHILTSARQPLRRLDIVHNSIQPGSFEMLRTRHFSTIQTIDLTHSAVHLASKWVIVVLESCPSLERIKAKVITGRDITKSKPWACQGLQEWIIAIDMDFDNLRIEEDPTSTTTAEIATEVGSIPPPTDLPNPLFPPTPNGPTRRLTKQERQACRAVYKRFSTLTRLREFDMLNSHSLNYLSTPGTPGHMSFSNPHHPAHRIISLPLRLHLGLHYLSNLTRLEKFCFWNGYMQVRHKEVEWIMGNWKSLKQLSGGFSIPNRLIRTVYTEFSWSVVFTPILKEHGISTGGSRYQHYDDSAEILAATEGGGEGEEGEAGGAGEGVGDGETRGPTAEAAKAAPSQELDEDDIDSDEDEREP
ncbi:hypothetical protein K457DRAFT_134969 [Linnemannia elongata AG-77]|uniref:F-box domain-containing protein n=1 Tax=Linnemannia elongata AG-77 TaxID=1314771 RepID=A0A197K845_9FUNG|nr:hypothetical protein K457DRAFT_134969 [Linnemannia elongata AG-77]